MLCFMDVRRVAVIVVPLAAFPRADGATDLMGYRPGGNLLTAPLRGSAHACARTVLETAGPRLLSRVQRWEPRLRTVTFTELPDGLRLIYTCAVPMTAPLVRDDDPQRVEESHTTEWQTVASATSGVGPALSDPVLRHVLNYWRNLLEETSAVVELLPKYFTTPQVRGVYEAVWARKLDPGNFHKWLHGQRPRICEQADPSQIAHDLDAAGRELVPDSVGDLSVAQATPSLVGTSPAALASTGLLALAPVPVLAAAVGGLVAYQAARRPGKQPDWFTACSQRRVNLTDLYAPRPAWDVPTETLNVSTTRLPTAGPLAAEDAPEGCA